MSISDCTAVSIDVVFIIGSDVCFFVNCVLPRKDASSSLQVVNLMYF